MKALGPGDNNMVLTDAPFPDLIHAVKPSRTHAITAVRTTPSGEAAHEKRTKTPTTFLSR
jgi:hypothetical protein